MGNAKSTVILMIMTTSRSAAPTVSPIDELLTPTLRMLFVSWIAALLAGPYVARLIRRTPRLRPYAVVVPLTLVLINGAPGGLRQRCRDVGHALADNFRYADRAVETQPATLVVRSPKFRRAFTTVLNKPTAWYFCRRLVVATSSGGHPAKGEIRRNCLRLNGSKR
jgi:hypothetical protein